MEFDRPRERSPEKDCLLGLTFYILRDKQSFSALLSPGRSKSTDVCSPWVQIIFQLKFFILDNALHVGLNFLPFSS